MKLLKKTKAAFRDFRKEYIIINVLYYGLVILGMVISAFNPSIQKSILNSANKSISAGVLSHVGKAYLGGHILSAMVHTFIFNLFIGSISLITIPSLIPIIGCIWGLLFSMFRAIDWGMIFSPIIPQMQLGMFPNCILLIVEGQAFIMAMLAVFIMLKASLFPVKVNAQSHKKGYIVGLKYTAYIYIAVTITFAIAAIYEALEVILIAPRLR